MASLRRDDGPLLVLGGSGFLGAHVVARGAGRGPVVAASRNPGPGGRPVDALAPGAVEELLADVAPAAVVITAALARVDACARDPERAAALNADLPERVARWCAGRGARLVHVSTDLVFGAAASRGERYDEDDPPSPAHAYGRSKVEGERRVLAACPAALVIRLPLLFGDSGGRGAGASDGLLAALERGERPRLFTDEWRTPLHVADAARALVELVDRGESGLLHVAGPERLSRLELGHAVLAARGLPPERVEPAVRADLGLADERPSDASLDASRARALLSTPLRTVREALASSP